MSRLRFALIGLITPTLALSGDIASAQQPPQPPGATPPAETVPRRAIEEVLVTATRREADIQDVPVAVTALSALQLERGGVQDLRDLQALTPSFNMNSSQTESQGSVFRIRGVGTTGNNIGLESAVGVFIDGVHVSRPGIALGDLVNLEAIEVLRGPQGTLFGRNTSAGALVIRTRAPDLFEPSYFVNAGAQNFSGLNIQAGGSVPLIEDRLAVGASVAVRRRNGFVKSTTGAESMDRDRISFRGDALWAIDDRSQLRIIADISEANEQCCDGIIVRESPIVAAGAFEAAGLRADGGAPISGPDALDDRRSNAQQFENPFEQWGVSAEFDRGFDAFDVIYIGSYRYFDASSVQHSDFVGLNVFSVRPQVAQGQVTFDEIETTTHELRIEGDTERLEWMVGGFFMWEDIVEEQGLGLERDFSRNTSANLFGLAPAPELAAGGFQAIGGLGVQLADGTPFGDVLGQDPTNPALAFTGGVDPAGSFARNAFNQTSRNWSVFTHNTLRVTDRFSLVAGLRWVDEDKDGTFEQFEANNPACLNALANAGAINQQAPGLPAEIAGLAAGAAAVTAGFTCFPFAVPAVDADSPFAGVLPEEYDLNFSDTELIWTVKGTYAFGDVTTGYASFTHGFKAGGFNLDATAAIGGADPRFDSETVDAYEIGLKTDLFDRRLRVNTALFYQDIEDFQVLEFTGVQFQTFNVPKAESMGVELEMQATPMDQLAVNLAVTYQDASYPSDCDRNDPDALPQVSALCGADLTNAPNWAGVLGITWEDVVPGTNLNWFAATNVRWESERRTSTIPVRDPVAFPDTPALDDFQDSNAKVDLRLGISGVDDRWALEVWGANIFDEQTKNVTFNVPLRGLTSVGNEARGVYIEAPRTTGVTFRLRR